MKSAINFLPKELRELSVYTEIIDLLDHEVEVIDQILNSIKFKFFNPYVQATKWSSGWSVIVGQYVNPTTDNGFYYQCIQAGITGSVEPTWATNKDDEVTDNDIKWTTLVKLDGLILDDIQKELIKETGFNYITDIFVAAGFTHENIVGLINIFHILKGHRKGLEIVFKILGFSYNITEWWETTPQGTLDTYDITVIVDVTQVSKQTITQALSVAEKIRDFLPQYVYPLADANIGPGLIVESDVPIPAMVVLSGMEITVYHP